ncbi:YceK/YidQ family lipoprotein [Desulfoluna butyratoxydans]|uniref:YceK/YidQ family lipoprotein n=1 Tax=Desulfoluna butyratoxydans TaxID=231438 RepID=UPI0015D2D244|nr:YceK/YidQ family lipoprotein [Desulfoluna butyratoxydans]
MDSYCNKIIILAIVLIASISNGCASIVYTFGTEDPMIYGGTRAEIITIADGCSDCYAGASWLPLLIIDTPLSLILDTVFLPITVSSYLDQAYEKEIISNYLELLNSSEGQKEDDVTVRDKTDSEPEPEKDKPTHHAKIQGKAPLPKAQER